MLYLKIMGSEDMPDHDQSKPHTMLTVSSYRTNMDEQGALFISYHADGADFMQRVFSNIYVMNGDGKTIGVICPGPSSPQ